MSVDEAIFAAVRRAVAPLEQEVRELRRALQARDEGATFGTPELEHMTGKKGSALREWLRRHPSFPRLKVGRKLVFSRVDVERYFEAHGRPGGAS